MSLNGSETEVGGAIKEAVNGGKALVLLRKFFSKSPKYAYFAFSLTEPLIEPDLVL